MPKYIILLFALIVACLAQPHPLDEYVARADDTYSYVPIGYYNNQSGYDAHVLNMTSQTWKDDQFSNSSVWSHHLSIMIPHVITKPDQAFIFISVGMNYHDPPTPTTDVFIPILGGLAEDTGAVFAMINQVPNQPIVFGEDESQRVRTEDDIIAWTWAQYLNQTADPPRDYDVLLYMPMVKSVVRAMDTVTDFCESEVNIDVNKFVLGGPSKRGWTTFLTAAADQDRVVGIMPMVMSLLNLVPNMHHHYQSLGGWSWAFEPYWREGLTTILDTPDADILAYMQDPYTFLDRYTMPKMQIKSGNDEFFMLDDFQFFLDDMPQTQFVLVLENSNHIMTGHWERLANDLGAFFVHVYEGYVWPNMSYSTYSDETAASVQVEVHEGDVVNVTGWTSTTHEDINRRDWRSFELNEYGNDTTLNWPRWEEMPVTQVEENVWRVDAVAPVEGWTGIFITVMFDVPENRTLEMSSDVAIVTNILPYDQCEGNECTGVLV